MDPDGIFYILLLLLFLWLTISSLAGLSNKAWNSELPIFIKLSVPVILISLVIFGIYKFVTFVGQSFLVFDIILYSASFLIALNFTLNHYRKFKHRQKNISPLVIVPAMVVLITLSLPFVLKMSASFFDYMNLMGSGG